MTSQIHERAFRNHPLTEAQQEINRQKSKIWAWIEQVFDFMSQSMKGFYLRASGRRRLRLINLIHNLAHDVQIVRLKLLPLPAA